VVKYYKLDKIFTQGTTYEMPNDRFYVIKRIGTNVTSDTKLVIDGVETGAINSEIAPIRKTSSNLLGPLDLKNLFYVVPPNKTFYVDGPSGAKVRCIGLIGVLAPGEAMPTSFAARFAEQGKHYWTYKKGSITLATAGGSWAAGDEETVLQISPKTIEKYILNRIVMAKVEGAGVEISEGMIGVRFYLEGTPLDVLTTGPGHKGIDILSMPYPPADSTEEESFTLEDLPIEVLGDHLLEIKVINVSGGAIAASDTVDMIATIAAIVEYLKQK